MRARPDAASPAGKAIQSVWAASERLGHALQQRHALWLCLVLLLAFGLRVHRLTAQDIWWDEASSALQAPMSLAEITAYQARDQHPPLYYWMLHFRYRMAGSSPLALRLFSVSWGVMGVAVAYALGRALFRSRGVALTGAFLLAISRFHIWWSQEIKMYAMLSTLSMLSLLLLWYVLADRGLLPGSAGHRRPLNRARREALRAGYVLVGIMAVYAHYIALLGLVGQNLYVAWATWRQHRLGQPWRKWLGRWLIDQGLVLAAALPWFLWHAQKSHTWTPAPATPWPQAARLVATLLALGQSTYVERYTWQTLAIWLFPLAALWPGAMRRRDRPGALLLWIALGSTAALTYILTLPMFGFGYEAKLAARFFILAQTPFDLLLGLALRRLKQAAGWPSLAALALVCAIQAPALHDYYLQRQASDSYTTLTRTIQAYAEPDDAIVLMNDSEWPAFHYYYAGELPIYHVPYGARGGAALIEPYVAPVMERHTGVWVVVSPQARQQDPDREVIGYLARSAPPCLSQVYDQRQLLLFRRSWGPLCAGDADGYTPQHVVERSFAPGLTLIGYDQALDEARTGQRVSVNTLWHAQAIYGRLRVQAGLVDEGGRLWGRLSQPALLLDLTGECSTKLVRSDLQITRDIPSGHYVVRAFLQTADDAQRWYTDLDHLRVRRTGGPSAQAAQREVSYTLGEGHLALRGYDLSRQSLRPGGELELTLYWQALRRMDTNYTVFVHLLGSAQNPRTGNPLWGQVDLEPIAGTYPTSAWTPGEQVVDRYQLTVDSDAPPGSYGLEIGLYDAHTGQRLPVYSAEGELLGDHLILSQIEVLPPRGVRGLF